MVGPPLGIMYVEITGILLSFVGLAVWNWVLTRAMATRIVMEVQKLDQSMAEIVERILGEGIMGDMEPINPIHAMLAQFIQAKIENMPRDMATVTPVKDEKGLFKKQP